MSKKQQPSTTYLDKKQYWLWPAYLGTLLLLGASVIYGAAKTGYEWDWSSVPGFIFDFDDNKPGPLLSGLWVTVKISLTAFFITAAIGLLVALARLFGGPVLRILAIVYLELIRNTPLMVQIFILYFVFGPILGLPRFWAAVLALSLFEGAYLSEIIRSGILAIAPQQWHAAWCLGFSTPETMRYIIVPQTLPMLLPPMVSLFISLIKDSALVSTIAIYDLTMQGQGLISTTLLTLEIWFVVALMYLILTLSLSALGTYLEKRAAIK